MLPCSAISTRAVARRRAVRGVLNACEVCVDACEVTSRCVCVLVLSVLVSSRVRVVRVRAYLDVRWKVSCII